MSFYRAGADQEAQAQKNGEFEPGQDVFFAACDFTGGMLKEVAVRELDDTKKQAACVLDGPQRTVSIEFQLTSEQAAGKAELLINARNNPDAGAITMTLNGRTFYEKAAPFGDQASKVARFPVPAGLATQTNVLAIMLAKDDLTTGVGGKQGDLIFDEAPPLAIYYAVFKCLEFDLKKP